MREIPTPRVMPIDYPAMCPPWLDEMPEDFSGFRPKQAKQFLEWYVSESSSRLELLLSAVRASDGPIDHLNFSYASCDLLWEWATQFFSVIPLPESEAKALRGQYPWHVAEDLALTDFALPGHWNKVLAPDIGFYVFEVFRHDHRIVDWGIAELRLKVPSRRAPAIFGFSMSSIRIIPFFDFREDASYYVKETLNPSPHRKYLLSQTLRNQASYLERVPTKGQPDS
ncbi:MAG: hypothetical protein KDB07_01045 [Planctomycetes bacterium]|nr:hypothetical protein [Planctomycetota bacterium]